MSDRPSPDRSAEVGDVLRSRQWKVVDGVRLVAGTVPILEFADERVSGVAGCNSFSGALSIEGDRWQTQGPFVSTLMACSHELMALDRELMSQLSRVTTCRVIESTRPTLGELTGPTTGIELIGIELIDDEGAVVLVLEAVEAARDLVGEWQVATMHVPERQAVLSPSGTLTVTVELDGATGRVSGHSGVNRFHGPLAIGPRIGAGAVRIGPLMSTRMAGRPAAIAEETHLLRALESTTGWRLGRRHSIDLLGADGVVAVSLVPREPAPG